MQARIPVDPGFFVHANGKVDASSSSDELFTSRQKWNSADGVVNIAANLDGMGIRYYAYPVRPDDVEAAKENPCPFHSEDPLMDAWGPEELRPSMLYLDKCWSDLQQLFADGDHAAAELVQGKVTHTPDGWIAFERAFDPDTVALIAEDLAEFDPDDAALDDASHFPDSVEYVREYLGAARIFTRELADAGYGLVYLIG